MKHYRMYLNGRWVDSKSGKRTKVVNPATGEVFATVPEGDLKDAEAAILAARSAFDSGEWPALTHQARGRLLFKIAELVRKNKAKLACLESINNGKPLRESEFDIDDVATCFEYYGGLATKIYGEVAPVPDNAVSLILKEPIGVAVGIVPWNYPLLMAAWKLAPALCAGCTCILKPASVTPLTVLELGKLFEEAGFPKGVVNIVTGGGSTVGMALASSRLVDKIAITGSVATGREIMKAAAESNLKKVTLELGGKSANIFLADSDFEAAIDGALFGIFPNQGEICSAGSRILVQKSMFDKFVATLVKKAKKIRLGDPLKKETQMGPLISADHYKKVMSYISLGKREGAEIACGGGRPKYLKGKLKKGYFVEPTIFVKAHNKMKIAQEEIFGPVVTIIPFKDEADAIKIANDSPYGLAGAVWTRDIFKAFRVVKAVRAGILWVNTMQPAYVEAPWGGYKQSGSGRELSHYGLEEYMQIKQVHINLNEGPIGWYE